MSTALRAERNRAKPRFRQTTMKGSGKRSEEDRISSICDALRQAIIEQALKPGTKLPEDSLGECFGVGRTIARQALARLTAEGLVEHRGTRVPRLRPRVGKKQGTCSICALASNVLLSVGLPETHPEQIAILRQHIAKEEAARNGREEISVRLATEFHTVLVELTGSPVLIRYVQEVCRRCGLTLTLYARPHSSDCAISEHIDIVNALEKGDAEAAMRIMSHHLEGVADRALISPTRIQKPSLMEILALRAGVQRHQSAWE